jgi:hypothetical protein
MESLTNTAIGFIVSLVTWIVVARQYVLRRLFNGRTPWAAIRGCMSHVSL